ncbi:septum formation protein Maf [Acidithiobacillus ferrooxidans]|jgi:septum formation protein|uniref:Maf family protein n=1 Tax=Acidithiobacillus ferrooxidans TaxID=920 RepID=UPI0013D05822|nr:Maf family protein [Acidithiobacillus ferrooxidans]MCL5957546.1 Maf family nucleotide pyrophosphatase [Gammaproteobacteria bacterium]MDA8152814.1 Maf family protein [Acidithiobacillus sp.]MBU2856308.1 septum formation protein Maf [Acidithiobacillus ferrooxidans]MBU2861662.1 septum formation protein Maf [Acidithiobacillus ferrooxidans]MCR2830424.1 Maf family nucleotide pyrophosphatase [Acidithiobacillus ferrooxidans]
MALPELILASTSPYRRDLLRRLQIPFRVETAAVDETPFPDETPETLVCRLADAKALAVAQRFPQAVVIGADQMAVCAGRVLGKPGNIEQAVAQLTWMQGQAVDFLNGVTVVAPSGTEAFLVPYRVVLYALTHAEIRRYVERDKPLDCAGSFRSEGLGISLVEHMEGEDPNALMGLPLIAVCRALRNLGYLLP